MQLDVLEYASNPRLGGGAEAEGQQVKVSLD